MKPFAVTLFVISACFIIACGDGGSSAKPPPGPDPSAPRDVIAFGARDANGENGLYLVRSDGTGRQLLSEELQNVNFPRWSPDGARLAFVVAGGRGPGTQATLRVYDFDGSVTTTVSEHVIASGDEAPMAWSPDGTRIAFIEAADGGTLRIFDLEKLALLDEPAVPATGVAWSADDKLTIVAAAGDATDLFELSPDDDEAQPFVEQDGQEGAPAWSPDGATLAFWGGPTSELAQRTLYVYTGGDTAKDVGPGLDPSWSSTERIAYSRPSIAGARGELDVYVSDGASEPQRLTQAVTLDRWPSWSPDGSRLVFLGQADASTAFVCVVALNGEENACFDLPDLAPGAPVWSPY